MAISPSAALPGGEVRIVGKSLRPHELRRPQVRFGDVEGAVVISSDDFLVARVPPGASSGPVVVSTNGTASNPHQIHVVALIAENLHPVTNPALDADGNIYVTFSGSRGQKVPVSIFKIDTSYTVKPFLTDMMNPTSIAFDRVRALLCLFAFWTGPSIAMAPDVAMSTYAEGMGVATGIAFDKDENLYVGDRSGTVFKIRKDRQIFVFATPRAQCLRLPHRLRARRRSVCDRSSGTSEEECSRGAGSAGRRMKPPSQSHTVGVEVRRQQHQGRASPLSHAPVHSSLWSCIRLVTLHSSWVH